MNESSLKLEIDKILEFITPANEDNTWASLSTVNSLMDGILFKILKNCNNISLERITNNSNNSEFYIIKEKINDFELTSSASTQRHFCSCRDHALNIAEERNGGYVF